MAEILTPTITPAPEQERCACGRPLHYTNSLYRAFVEEEIAARGPEITVTTPAGTFAVQRHYLGLHGLAAADLPFLAAQGVVRRITPAAGS